MARTLDELAALTGVSRATVSRVINGGSVAEGTRRKVLEAMERTNFRPNQAARSLASGRTGVVGVVMHLDPTLLFADPYFSGLLQGMSSVLAEEAVGMMLWLGDRSREDTLDQISRRGMLDGVIVTAHWLEDPIVDGLLESETPTVLIGHRRTDDNASYVDVDNVRAADTVTTHLIELGRRRIGHIAGRPGSVSGSDRQEGYRRAMERAGLSVQGLMVQGDFSYQSGVAGARALLEAGVDAIFCANDASAEGVLATLREGGVAVPGDVAVAGFDDLGFASRLDPPLTTMRQGVLRQGSEAARVLLQLLDDPSSGPRRVVLPTELMVRRSTVGAVGATV